MQSIPLVRKVALAPAVAYLAAEGVPVDRHLRRAKLAPPTPETLEQLIPLHQLCEFLNDVSRAEGMDDLGFQIAGQQGIESLGTYGQLLAQACTLYEQLQISQEFLASYNSGLKIWFECEDGQVRYYQKYSDTLPRNLITEVVHLGLVNAVAIARFTADVAWRPNRIQLASGPIDVAQYIQGSNTIPVDFNCEQTAVWFDESLLSAPLPAYAVCESVAIDDQTPTVFRATAPASDPIGQLEQVIESTIDHPELGLPMVASILGTSPRTLQRRLCEYGLGFSRVVRGVRFKMAQQLLRDPRMPLAEIARRLGYANLANFIRAFRDWTGVAPGRYRKLHCCVQN